MEQSLKLLYKSYFIHWILLKHFPLVIKKKLKVRHSWLVVSGVFSVPQFRYLVRACGILPRQTIFPCSVRNEALCMHWHGSRCSFSSTRGTETAVNFPIKWTKEYWSVISLLLSNPLSFPNFTTQLKHAAMQKCSSSECIIETASGDGSRRRDADAACHTWPLWWLLLHVTMCAVVTDAFHKPTRNSAETVSSRTYVIHAFNNGYADKRSYEINIKTEPNL